MTQSKKIAVTGGIGSGKSLFCEILKERGYAVFSCDVISKQLRGEEEYLALVKRAFPDCVADGKLCEDALSKKVFSDPEARKTLEGISHPLIMKRLFAQMEGCKVSFAEVPLLYEVGFEGAFDAVIALVREKEARIRSVIARSGLTRDEVIARIQSQFDETCLPEKGCIIVENNGSYADLQKKAEKCLLALNL